jgi:hypothetical protein
LFISSIQTLQKHRAVSHLGDSPYGSKGDASRLLAVMKKPTHCWIGS